MKRRGKKSNVYLEGLASLFVLSLVYKFWPLIVAGLALYVLSRLAPLFCRIAEQYRKERALMEAEREERARLLEYDEEEEPDDLPEEEPEEDIIEPDEEEPEEERKPEADYDIYCNNSIEKEKARLERVMEGLLNKQDKLEYLHVGKNTQRWRSLEYDLTHVARRIEALEKALEHFGEEA